MNREHWHLSIRQLFCFAKSNEESKSSKCKPTTAKQASTATTTIKVHYSETKIQTAKPSGQTVEKSKFRCGKGDIDTKKTTLSYRIINELSNPEYKLYLI